MADRYWVGGTGTWDATTTTNWSTSSGGGGGASVPTSADNVFFNSASNATSYTVTLGNRFVGTASYSIISSMTTQVEILTITSGGTVGVGSLIYQSGFLFRVTSLGTGTGGLGTYNCSVLRGSNGTGNSGSAAYAPQPVCADISCSGPATGSLLWVVTNSGIEVAGSVTVAASGVTMSSTQLFLTGSSTHTITTNSTSMPSVFLIGTGTYTLGTAYTSGGTLYFSLGTFTTNNFDLTVSLFDQGAGGTRTINLGSSTVNITGSSYPFGSATPANFGANATFNAGTSQINISATIAFYVGFGLNKTFYNVSFISTAISQTTGITLGSGTTDNPTFNNLTIAGQTTLGLAQVFIATNMTINGTFTINAGTAAAYRIRIASNTSGTARTLTCAAVSFTDTDFIDITIAGAASPATGTRLGDGKNNSGITFTAAKTVFYRQTGSANWGTSGTGSWSATSGGALDATQFPLAQDTAVFPAATYPASGSTTTISAPYNIGTIDMSLRTTNTMTLATGSTALTIYGNWINGTGITFTGSGTLTFAGRTTQTITSAGKTFTQAITINSPSGLVTLQDALTENQMHTLTNGTLDLQSYTLSTPLFSSSNSNTRTIAFGTGQISCTGTSIVWTTQTSTNLTTTGTQVVNVTSVGSTAITVIPGALSEANSISFNFTGGTYALSCGGSSSTVRNLNFTGYAGTLGEVLILTIYGNLTLSTGMSLTASTFQWAFGATSGTKTITSNGKTLDFPLTFNGVGGTFQLQDALTMGSTRAATLTNGTLDLFGQTLTVGTAFTTATGTKNLTFNGGTLVCPTAATTAFNNAAPTNFTTTAGTGTGTISMTAATAKTFVGGSSTFNCTLNQGGAGDLTITGSNTFSNITNTYSATGATSILFTAATTSTFTNWNASGSAGNLLTIGSVTAASHTLSKTSGIVTATYLSISRSTATGGATWNATFSTNGGNNSGWNISAAAIAVASRITSAGVLSIAGELDEVTLTTIRLTSTFLYSSEFDEYTLQGAGGGLAKRETAAGKIQVTGSFDEYNKPYA